MLDIFPWLRQCIGNDCGSQRGAAQVGVSPIPCEVDAHHSYKASGPAFPQHVDSLQDSGIVTYATDLNFPVFGPQVRRGEVWHLPPNGAKIFARAILCLYKNGFILTDLEGAELQSLSWSPFSVVQSCRLHNAAADKSQPLLRTFRVFIFSQAWCHLFAVEGPDADAERAQWVAEISCVLRIVTQSLFPPFSIAATPLLDARWTSTRLLAGYLLLCHQTGVLLLYCELHTHWDAAAAFNAYVDESCTSQVLALKIRESTVISEVIGVNCSCFSIHGKHFSARTNAEKVFWLRAMGNIQVKIQHHAPNPTQNQIAAYRESVMSSAHVLESEQAASRPRSKSVHEMVREPSVDVSQTEETTVSDVVCQNPQHNSNVTGSTANSLCSTRLDGWDTGMFLEMQRASAAEAGEQSCAGTEDCNDSGGESVVLEDHAVDDAFEALVNDEASRFKHCRRQAI